MGAGASSSKSSPRRSTSRSNSSPQLRNAAVRNTRALSEKPKRSLSLRFETILDKYTSLEQVQEALRAQGLESSQLIVGVDFTKSNEWTGRKSFGGRCLHTKEVVNPYQEAVSIIGRTLQAFDDDQYIPCYGFGDASTHDKDVFSFRPGDEPCEGFEDALACYRDIVPHVRLAGPTSFAPLIYKAMDAVVASGHAYHILLIVADGQVTRNAELPVGYLSPQEKDTMEAIVAASKLPLSIVMVGVGDGPWDVMQAFDDALPSRKFDNFQFVNYMELRSTFAKDAKKREAAFALRALMEIPDQYRAISMSGMVNAPPKEPLRRPPPKPALDPPMPGLARSSSLSRRSSSCTRNASFTRNASGQESLLSSADNLNPLNPRFVCPITQDVMLDPVFAADGYTYERTAITRWLSSRHTSPMLNTPLAHKELTPNHPLRSEIKESLEAAAISARSTP